MSFQASSQRGTWLAIGLVIGLVVGGFWPHAPAHAVATDRYENFAICTAPVDGSLEALYVLDYVTGDLRAFVLSTQVGKFNAMYSRNIVADMGVAGNQNPHYLMVSGIGKVIPRGARMQRAAESVLYVAWPTSGTISAYVLPFGGQAGGAGMPVQGALLPLDVIPFRNPIIRQPAAGGNK